MFTTRALLVASVVMATGSGCDKSSAGPSKASSGQEPPLTLVGIYPKDWTCEQIASPADVGTLLAGTAHAIDTGLGTTEGVPRPCSYLVVTSTGEQPWTFDLDCRPSYKQTADALFADYTRTSQEQVDRYNAAADGGAIVVPPDAGPQRAPELAHEVPVGAKGLDHHGQGLLFIDDDTPCYVRVVGPDADHRLALAQFIVKHLVPATAPMTPRASR